MSNFSKKSSTGGSKRKIEHLYMRICDNAVLINSFNTEWATHLSDSVFNYLIPPIATNIKKKLRH